jgi:hypothetical protein
MSSAKDCDVMITANHPFLTLLLTQLHSSFAPFVLQGYLASVTAKDCGVMITLQRVMWRGKGPEPGSHAEKGPQQGSHTDKGPEQAGQPGEAWRTHQSGWLGEVTHGSGKAAGQVQPGEAWKAQQPSGLWEVAEGSGKAAGQVQPGEAWEAQQLQELSEVARQSAAVLQRPFSLVRLEVPGSGGQQYAWFKYKVCVCACVCVCVCRVVTCSSYLGVHLKYLLKHYLCARICIVAFDLLKGSMCGGWACGSGARCVLQAWHTSDLIFMTLLCSSGAV